MILTEADTLQNSWLSGTLGLLPDTECNAHPDACSIASSTAFPIEKGNHAAVNMKLDLDMIQSQLAKVGFLMGEIVKNVYAAGVCSIRSIETYVEKLEEWHKDLPQYMRLETLLGEESEPVTKRAVLLVHLVYLGSIILVTRKMITELVRRPAGSPWKFDGTKEEAVHYMELCIASAKSIAMIVGILYDDNVISKRCWMILYCPPYYCPWRS